MKTIQINLILVAIAFALIMINSRHDTLKERISFLEEENKKITSNLEIMNIALEKGGLLIWKSTNETK